MALSDDDESFRERVWRRMISERPELEHAVLEIPEPSVARRVAWAVAHGLLFLALVLFLAIMGVLVFF